MSVEKILNRSFGAVGTGLSCVPMARQAFIIMFSTDILLLWSIHIRLT